MKYIILSFDNECASWLRLDGLVWCIETAKEIDESIVSSDVAMSSIIDTLHHY